MTDQAAEVQVVETQDQTAISDEQNVAPPEQVTEANQEENQTQVEEPKTKTFSQEELDRIIQKEKAKAEARAERRALKAYAEKLEAMSQKPVEKQEPKADDGKPTMAQFGDDVEGYVEAVAEWKIRQRSNEESQRIAEQHERQTRVKADKLYAEAEKFPGFDVDTFEGVLTPSIAQAVIDSDVAPQLMAYISSNADEIERIASLSPARQAVEIGKLEVKLSAAKPVKVSNAPAPIKPVGGKSGSSSKPIHEMSYEELREFEKKRGARYA